jgi:hypothetical protein
MSNVVLCWFFSKLLNLSLNKYKTVFVYKSSNCSVCGALITTPDSLIYNVGAVCMHNSINNGNLVVQDELKIKRKTLKQIKLELWNQFGI